jgi:biotin operon repressor
MHQELGIPVQPETKRGATITNNHTIKYTPESAQNHDITTYFDTPKPEKVSIKKRNDYTPTGWQKHEKRPYNPVSKCRVVNLDENLSDESKVFMAEILYCGGDKGYSWPGIDTIGRAIKKSRRAVIRNIKKLVEAGYLVAERRHSTSSIFTLGPKLISKQEIETSDSATDGNLMVPAMAPCIVPPMAPSTPRNCRKPREIQDIEKTDLEFEKKIRQYKTNLGYTDLLGPNHYLSKEKYPAWDNIPNVDAKEIWAILSGERDDNPNILN